MSIASGLAEEVSDREEAFVSNSRVAHALMSKFSSTFNVSRNKLAPCTLFVSAVIVLYWPFCSVPYCAMLAKRQHV